MAQGLDDVNVGYTVGKWSNQKNYKCDSCAFATLDKTQIEAHVAEKHTPQVVEVPSVIVDASGNPITKEVVIPPADPGPGYDPERDMPEWEDDRTPEEEAIPPVNDEGDEE